jgi:hypothetical protein
VIGSLESVPQLTAIIQPFLKAPLVGNHEYPANFDKSYARPAIASTLCKLTEGHEGSRRDSDVCLRAPSCRFVVIRYAGRVADERRASDEQQRVGLCVECRRMRRIVSERGSVFFLCRLSVTDASFPKYPRLPVRQCPGFSPK